MNVHPSHGFEPARPLRPRPSRLHALIFKALLLAVIVPGPLAQAALPRPAVPDQVDDTQAYLRELKSHLASYRGAIGKEIATGDARVYYATSYYLQGLAACADATGDVEVMDALVGFLTQMMAKAQPVVRNGHTYQEWGPFAADGTPGLLNTFQATGPLARAAAVIANNPVFAARYGPQAEQLEAFVDQAIFKYWFDKATGYYARPKSSWRGGDIPWLPVALGGWGTYLVQVDTCSHLGMIATWMYQATRSPLYLEYATRVAKGFRTHVTVRNGAWVWDQGKVPIEAAENQEGTPDTSHSNREAMMVVSMYEAGIEFRGSDIAQLATTFTRLIWNRNLDDPRFANYINGSNKGYRKAQAWENGIIYHGWDMLGRHSPEVQQVLAASYRTVKAQGALNPSLASNASTYGRVELAGTLARNTVH